MPAIFRMDDAPAFSSDVMRAFYSIMGVKHVDISAPDDALLVKRVSELS